MHGTVITADWYRCVVLVTQIPQLVLPWWCDFPKLLTILGKVLNQVKYNLPLIYMIATFLKHSVYVKPLPNHFAFCRNWALCSDHYKLNFYLCGFLEDTQSDMELMEIFYLRLSYEMQFIQRLIPLLTKFSFCFLNVTRTTAKAPYPHPKSSPPSRSRRYCFHSGWSP